MWATSILYLLLSLYNFARYKITYKNTQVYLSFLSSDLASGVINGFKGLNIIKPGQHYNFKLWKLDS